MRHTKKVKLQTPLKGEKKRASSPHPEKKAHQPMGKDVAPIPQTPKGKEKAIEGNSTPNSKREGKARDEEHPIPTSFKLVAGSYEKLLYGLDGFVTLNDESKLEFHLKPIFIFPAHVSCIKAVAASPQGGKWLATGSADEIIKVWDLRRRKEIGGLMHHEGSITHLLFPSRSHLLSASEDGSLCLFRARDWAVLRALKGHKGRINSVAVHPTGKVALSVGKDRTLRMWDLMRGKGVASTKLGKEGEIVRWSVDGSKFVVQSGSTMDVYATNMDPLHAITHPSRIHDVKFCKRVDGEGEILLVAAEDRKLYVYQVPTDSATPSIVAEMIGHQNRVKAVQTLEMALPEASGRKSTTIAATVSSDGFINVYDIAAIPSSSENPSGLPKTIEPQTSYDSKGTRLTCITLADGDASSAPIAGSGKRKRDEDAEEEEGSEDDDDAYGANLAEDEEQEDNEEEEEE
ncbi:unnamed protein product [Cyclocybe aegerita]|uniref:WD40 repeat-like protein n=1 Tax=Cyclocybe aegerita TaxID=1973307 RepID=A0A8S0VZW0_CYCAE|nr:unnamed protein product [Cyclocybe aegerita]